MGSSRIYGMVGMGWLVQICLCPCELESVQDFLIKLDMKPCMRLVEISIVLLGDQLLLKRIKMLYFLKACPTFVGSVHNFGKSDYEKI